MKPTRPVVVIERDALLSGLAVLKGLLAKAREHFDHGDRLEASCYAVLSLYGLLERLDGDDVDGHRVVVMDLFLALTDIRSGVASADWLRPREAELTESGEVRKGRPPGRREPSQTWNLRTLAAIVYVWMVRAGVPPDEAGIAIAETLRHHGVVRTKAKPGETKRQPLGVFKSVTDRIVADWVEKLQEGPPSAPAPNVEHFKRQVLREIFDFPSIDAAKTTLLRFLSDQLTAKGFKIPH